MHRVIIWITSKAGQKYRNYPKRSELNQIIFQFIQIFVICSLE